MNRFKKVEKESGGYVCYFDDKRIGDIVIFEDGYYYFDPYAPGYGGVFSESLMRVITEELSSLNEWWGKEIEEVFNRPVVG